MQILDQAIVQYEGVWTQVGTLVNYTAATDIANRVGQRLLSDGLSVKDLQVSGAGIFGGGPFNVSLKLQVTNGLGFASENDIILLVRHEVFTETNVFPSADTIPTVQNPNSSATDTGQGHVAPQDKPSNVTLWDSIKNLFSDTKLVLVGLGIGLIVAVLLIASPRKVAPVP
jgi:hypothetical protein